ncbi:cell division protein ZapA [Rossellomorea vietnamensis]|uniref:Cell division protein ZapA n=2 Tax=Rossellomorea TaxID=2837508 RepID=A0A5D4KJF7_9BACI|nr:MULTISPECIES: cell division protein ZapA [Rossellomorea]TYR77106.1 cell division protein ZapA [Rossellomorea vietnamensis]TYS84311.1 cell division protein ZapA [Rossellomorea aquimaris]
MSQEQKNRTTVDIYGTQYVIVGTESTSHIRQVASLVDEKMREISSMNSSLDKSKLAVLTAVNTLHDNLKLKEYCESLEEELKKLKD